MMSTDYRFGNAELRPAQRLLLVGGKESRIGARAFDLLLALVEHRDRVVAKNELIDSVWSGLVVEENNLQVHISSLRKVLGQRAIATVPGRGYRFTGAVDGAANDRQIEFATTSQAAPAPQSLTNLPAELPPLYGRATDAHLLCSLLDQHRLVTVVGAGGIGKTALALEVVHQLRDRFADGVWRVDLAPVSDGSLLATTVASVVQVMLRAEDQEESLAKALCNRQALLLLDNCEHLAGAVARLDDALYRIASCVKVLATSQEPLKVPAEHVYRLGALDVSPQGDDEGARECGAVTLFAARARAADPSFSLDARNVRAVADICRRLDGIPLAIELAAARVSLLGVDGVGQRLGERFRLLTGGSRLGLARHQTLRAALVWSHGLLTPEEQKVFRRLGVFAGSFRLDSAQRVASGDRIDEWAVLDHLGALVDKSLVVAEPGDEPRYRLLETARAFALERLGEAGETQATLCAHAKALLALFERSLQDEFVLSRQARLDRYLPDLDDARAALDWAGGTSGDKQLLLGLAGAIGWIWVYAGLRAEGLRRTRAVMAGIDSTTPAREEARLQACWLLLSWPEVGPAEIQAGARAVELYRLLGDRVGLFCTLCDLGRRQGLQGDLHGGERSIREAEQMRDDGWPPQVHARLLAARGCLALDAGRYEETISAYGELHRVAVALGDKRLEVIALVNREQGVAALGRWSESVACGRRLLALLEQDRALRSGLESVVVSNLCLSLTEMDEIDEALRFARRTFALREQEGNGLCILDPFARLAFKRGFAADAARILGRADMRYETSHFARQAVELKVRDLLLGGLRATLAPQDLARLMKEGQTLSDDAAAALALQA